MPITPVFALLAVLAGAGETVRPDPEALLQGLGAPGRQAREQATSRIRAWARTDPAGAAAIWGRLDLRGRCLLVRALAGTGTRHAADVALAHAAGAEDEVFRALLAGLIEGGDKAMAAATPAKLAPGRRRVLDALRLRWRAETELARLKSASGPTGHYKGQYERLRQLGPGVLPILFDILLDRAHPLPGEDADGPYRSIHPWMVRFEHDELRLLAAYAFAELVSPGDTASIERLDAIRRQYESLYGERFELERESLAPALAFALFDLGRPEPAEDYVRSLRRRARGTWISYDVLEAWWELGFALIRLGRPDEGQRWYERLLEHEESTNRAITAYNLACSFAMRALNEPRRRDSFTDLALDWLERAVFEFHYSDWQWMEEDRDLDFVRDRPRYARLLAHLRRKYPDRRKGRVPKELVDFLKQKPDGK